MSNAFVSKLEAIGKDFEKGLGIAVKYVVPVASIIGILFPQTAPADATAVAVVNLVANTVMLVEQKYAAMNKQNATGPQKLAEVMAAIQEAVVTMLKSSGLNKNADQSYVTKIVNLVVLSLNSQNALPVQLPSVQ